MFKKFLAALIMIGFTLVSVGSVSARDKPQFLPFYGPNSACFMTMAAYYGNDTSPAWICSKIPVVVNTAYKSFVVFFDFDSDVIKADQTATLEDALADIKSTKPKVITLTAFCDFRGPDDYNLSLGSRRVESIRSWFSKKGVDKEFAIVNYGKKKSPIRKLDGKFCSECWNDRRVEIDIK